MSGRTMHPGHDRDRGAILPLVLAVSIFFALVIVALARLVTTDLSFARVAEARAERSASALSAIDYGVERIRLGQTLCTGPTPSFGPVTTDILNRNGTTTTLSCTRLATDGSEITGWAAVITGLGITNNLLQLQGGGTADIHGSVYVDDLTDVAMNSSDLEQHGGDLWHKRTTCPGGNVPSGYTFEPAVVRGSMCTTATWDQIVSTPLVPDLTQIDEGAPYSTVGSCRVFAPGHYTVEPSLGSGDVYFQSGVYWFDWPQVDIGAIEPSSSQMVWFGHPGTNTVEIPNPDCSLASQFDPNVGGTGAAVYLSRHTRFRAQGKIEFFDRLVGGTRMSIHALDPGSGYTQSERTAASNSPIIRVRDNPWSELVVHGLVYAPRGWVEFLNTTSAAKQQLLGGAVVARLSMWAATSPSSLVVTSAPTPTLVKIQLTATSVATDGSGATTTVSAIVDYRPDAIDPDRVAVNSIRIVD